MSTDGAASIITFERMRAEGVLGAGWDSGTFLIDGSAASSRFSSSSFTRPISGVEVARAA